MTKSSINKTTDDINDNTSGNIVIQFCTCINMHSVYHMIGSALFSVDITNTKRLRKKRSK
jgi:hypothetical protein